MTTRKSEFLEVKCYSCGIPRLECIDWGRWSAEGWLCRKCNRCSHCDKRHGTLRLLDNKYLCRRCNLLLKEGLDDFTSV